MVNQVTFTNENVKNDNLLFIGSVNNNNKNYV